MPHHNEQEQRRIEDARRCTNAGIRAGAKSATIAALIATPTVLLAARTIPFVKRNLNYTGQALFISSAAIAAYFIVADQTILECARTTSFNRALEAEADEASRS